jgi:hypothetical protein
MELADGVGFAILVAAATADNPTEDDDRRADGEAGDETIDQGLHAELDYQRLYPGHFVTNVQQFLGIRLRAAPHTAEPAAKIVAF